MGEGLHITFVFNAHGIELNGRYFIRSDQRFVNDTELLSALPKANITLALLTCHSGAFNVPYGIDVFGASSSKTPCYEYAFYNFLKEVKKQGIRLEHHWIFSGLGKKARQAPTFGPPVKVLFPVKSMDTLLRLGTKILPCCGGQSRAKGERFYSRPCFLVEFLRGFLNLLNFLYLK